MFSSSPGFASPPDVSAGAGGSAGRTSCFQAGCGDISGGDPVSGSLTVSAYVRTADSTGTIISKSGWNNAIARQWQVKSIPKTYVLDKKGLIRHVDLRGDELVEAVEKLLGEKP